MTECMVIRFFTHSIYFLTNDKILLLALIGIQKWWGVGTFTETLCNMKPGLRFK